MTAYQNYLGGGMLGSIQTDCQLSDYKEHPHLVMIAEKLKMYFHTLLGNDLESYEETQSMPSSAY